VKDEVVRVAGRHSIPMSFVSNSWMRGPDHPLAQRISVEAGLDVADDWIAERAGAGDIVITNDIPLAVRCVAKGAVALRPDGTVLDQNSIGMASAARDLATYLRETGARTTGPAPFTKADRSRFLNGLENTVQAIKRRT
jgi:uncharacterized protein YaiI (UPF0178 family)